TIEGYDYQTSINLTGGVRAMRVVHNRSLITNTAGLSSAMGPWRAFNNVPTFTPGAGSSMTALDHIGANMNVIYSNTGVGNTILRHTGVATGGDIGASWT